MRKLFGNWEHVILLRVRTLQGIDIHDTFEPSDQFNRFVTRAQNEMNDLIKRRTKMMCDLGIKLQRGSNPNAASPAGLL